ncbi:hypothetical protein SAMD00019534_067030 [Acytostelium subglobosum LB1]|uniref:hypothetical protein n=1 Tax=Acytostelium subglobosum LB1 TaxID=1410327 RepID=UPI000644C2BB|nr:hypothetical protein SAMD00019534_067030 [Acytostelium subglobosum LB1]GAM23528.1 hypothetical protein SAMD00019534_067030 [Acytostelium subglobosum LB1]|eukprot:XP_012753269.1 hypothetical protein SAMD00019534_067030 [Acytostelium subglobosum LB1]
MQTISPRLMPRISIPDPLAPNRIVQFKNGENISFFLQACADVGVPRHKRFTSADLQTESPSYTNIRRIIECLESLCKIANADTQYEFSVDWPTVDATQESFSEEEMLEAEQMLAMFTIRERKRLEVVQRSQSPRKGTEHTVEETKALLQHATEASSCPVVVQPHTTSTSTSASTSTSISTTTTTPSSATPATPNRNSSKMYTNFTSRQYSHSFSSLTSPLAPNAPPSPGSPSPASPPPPTPPSPSSSLANNTTIETGSNNDSGSSFKDILNKWNSFASTSSSSSSSSTPSRYSTAPGRPSSLLINQQASSTTDLTSTSINRAQYRQQFNSVRLPSSPYKSPAPTTSIPVPTNNVDTSATSSPSSSSPMVHPSPSQSVVQQLQGRARSYTINPTILPHHSPKPQPKPQPQPQPQPQTQAQSVPMLESIAEEIKVKDDVLATSPDTFVAVSPTVESTPLIPIPIPATDPAQSPTQSSPVVTLATPPNSPDKTPAQSISQPSTPITPSTPLTTPTTPATPTSTTPITPATPSQTQVVQSTLSDIKCTDSLISSPSSTPATTQSAPTTPSTPSSPSPSSTCAVAIPLNSNANRQSLEVRAAIKIQRATRRWLERTRQRIKERHNAYRERIALEITKTEEEYLTRLLFLRDHMLKDLREAIKKGSPIISEEEVRAIFSSELESIILTNTMLKEELQRRLKAWDTDTQIGDIFLKFSSFLKVYSQYSINYETAIEVLNECQKQPKFRSYLNKVKEKNEEIKLRGLEDHLIRPIQRIPRYSLLLREMITHTWPSHRDYQSLEKAFASMNTVAEKMNEAKRNAENRMKLAGIQEKLDGESASTVVKAHRRFVKEGDFFEVESPKFKKHPKVLYLFNDLLAVTKPTKSSGSFFGKQKTVRLQFERSFVLTKLRLSELDDTTNYSNALKISTTSQDSLIICANDRDTRDEWVAAILAEKTEAEKHEKEQEERITSSVIHKVADTKLKLEQQFAQRTSGQYSSTDLEAAVSQTGEDGSPGDTTASENGSGSTTSTTTTKMTLREKRMKLVQESRIHRSSNSVNNSSNNIHQHNQ